MSNVTQWHGCYNDSWNGVITPDAFAHPAKFARGLIRRIYQHMLDSGYIAAGDSVVDPFGGVGLGGLDAMTFGLHYVGCELEPRFVELGNRNIDKWQRDLAMLNDTLGTARLLQGDSRRLVEVVGAGMGAAVSSPPYDSNTVHSDTRAGERHSEKGGQLGRWGMHLNGVSIQGDYGSTPGQLGSMPSGDYAAVVSSPPYSDMIDGWVEGAGARHDHKHHNPDTAERLSSDTGYGTTPGNIGHMRDGGFERATERNEWLDSATLALFDVLSGAARERAQEEAVNTFWTAARAIVEQTYAALRPGGYAAWVTKCFVRKGAIVPFSDQWQQLCAAVGFEPVERIAAMLVDDHGSQLDIFGGATPRRTERKSFFRRLAEKKGSPRIDWEDVIIMRKPNRAAHANGNGARSDEP